MPLELTHPGLGDVRRVVGAFTSVTVGEWALGTAAAIAAYVEAGSLAVGLVGFRFVVAALAGLWTSGLAERARSERVLSATALARALAGGAATAALALGLPFGIVVAIVWLDAAAGSAYRPAQAALLPSVVATPAQLMQATTLTSNAKTVGQVAGALAGSLALAATSASAGAALATALYLLAAAATATITPTVARARRSDGLGAREALGGLSALRLSPGATRIAAWTSVRALLRGLWTALGVIAALETLGMGESGFGILMLAAGAGAVVAVPITHALIGRRTLARWLAGGLALSGGALIAIGATAAAPAAVALMVAWGVGMTLSDASAQGLLHRVVHAAALARVVGTMEAAKQMAEGLGALLAPALVALTGVRGALVAGGGLALAAISLDLRALMRVDDRAAGRVRVLELMRRVPLFAPLRLDGLEAVAAQVGAEPVSAGVTVVRQDEPGSRWYLVADGVLDVSVDGHQVGALTAGNAFGERALLRDVPRNATVTARTDAELLSLERADFLAAVVGVTADAASGPAARSTALEVLRRQPLLGPVSQQAVEALAHAATAIEVAAGDRVVESGRRDDRWLVILEGELEVERDGRPPRRLGPGDALGEIAVLHEIPRTATAVALTRATLLAIPGGELRSALSPQAGSGPR